MIDNNENLFDPKIILRAPKKTLEISNYCPSSPLSFDLFHDRQLYCFFFIIQSRDTSWKYFAILN